MVEGLQATLELCLKSLFLSYRYMIDHQRSLPILELDVLALMHLTL
jgi:hypothetical protein